MMLNRLPDLSVGMDKKTLQSFSLQPPPTPVVWSRPASLLPVRPARAGKMPVFQTGNGLTLRFAEVIYARS